MTEQGGLEQRRLTDHSYLARGRDWFLVSDAPASYPRPTACLLCLLFFKFSAVTVFFTYCELVFFRFYTRFFSQCCDLLCLPGLGLDMKGILLGWTPPLGRGPLYADAGGNTATVIDSLIPDARIAFSLGGPGIRRPF